MGDYEGGVGVSMNVGVSIESGIGLHVDRGGGKAIGIRGSDPAEDTRRK